MNEVYDLEKDRGLEIRDESDNVLLEIGDCSYTVDSAKQGYDEGQVNDQGP